MILIWKWSKQALGIPGHLLGWTGYMQKKINENALHSLKRKTTMILQTLKTIFKRDLNRLKQELNYIKTKVKSGRFKRHMNSARNLCLHVVGNLTFIGATLETPIARNRELEFSLKDIQNGTDP
jgi:hypothetical protein